MCGIVGYIGCRSVDFILLEGLKRLEYRGYDSAGICTISDGKLLVRKRRGKLRILNEAIKDSPLGGNIGIGHTRWATHGEPSESNAHPHLDCHGKVAVVHNGIIENYHIIKERLISEGHIFTSETDTEVLPHLIEKNYRGDLVESLKMALKEIKGSYAICVISEREPDKILIARCGSPLIIGLGRKENFVASDLPAILPLTRRIIHLNDNEIGIVKNDNIEVIDFEGNTIEKKVEFVSLKTPLVEKGDYEYFMLKEIYEQPEIMERIIERRIKDDFPIFDDLNLGKKYLSQLRRIVIQACGTSWHAGLVGKFWLEKYAHINTEVDISSEFKYRDPILEGDTLMLAISQSGETADTLASVREGKSKFIKVLSLVNQESSAIARESDAIISILAGPEIGVASTKAYTAELLNLLLFSLFLGELNYTITKEEVTEIISEVRRLPYLMRKALLHKDYIIQIAEEYSSCKDFIYLARGINYPNALEGALKLKELAYIHASGYPAGEFKHGPIALVKKGLPILCIAVQGELYEKMLSNIEEVRSRGGDIISVVDKGGDKIREISKYCISLPTTKESISPIITILPLQLLAYFIALKLGCDVDKPKNLAKSVTVE